MKLGMIGCGNMGGALAKAAAKSAGGSEMLLADFLPEKAAALATELNASVGSNDDIAEKCRYIFLGVKPQMMADMLSGIRPTLKRRKDRFVLVTMAAGLPIARISEWVGGDVPVIRIMPNTPAQVGAGMILYTANDAVTANELREFEELLRFAGKLDRLPEHLIDAGSAVSGCGPAFVCLFAEALADGGVACGLPRDKALLYAAQTLMGTAQLMLESGQHPGVLKDAVCSPAGSTIAGVQALEEGAFRSDAMKAVLAAFRRTQELGK